MAMKPLKSTSLRNLRDKFHCVLSCVVVHVFHMDARDFYRIEKLWGDADFYTLNEDKLSKMNKTQKQQYLTELTKERRIPERYQHIDSFDEDGL